VDRHLLLRWIVLLIPARCVLADGAELVVMGHLHHPELKALPGGQVAHLGGFGVDGVWCALDAGGPRLVVAEG
jgi:UDP-2,3-diacylglucosamine pyrophosphatase LpxH